MPGTPPTHSLVAAAVRGGTLRVNSLTAPAAAATTKGRRDLMRGGLRGRTETTIPTRRLGGFFSRNTPRTLRGRKGHARVCAIRAFTRGGLSHAPRRESSGPTAAAATATTTITRVIVLVTSMTLLPLLPLHLLHLLLRLLCLLIKRRGPCRAVPTLRNV